MMVSSLRAFDLLRFASELVRDSESGRLAVHDS